jgi:hypothetical protein
MSSSGAGCLSKPTTEMPGQNGSISGEGEIEVLLLVLDLDQLECGTLFVVEERAELPAREPGALGTKAEPEFFEPRPLGAVEPCP